MNKTKNILRGMLLATIFFELLVWYKVIPIKAFDTLPSEFAVIAYSAYFLMPLVVFILLIIHFLYQLFIGKAKENMEMLFYILLLLLHFVSSYELIKSAYMH